MASATSPPTTIPASLPQTMRTWTFSRPGAPASVLSLSTLPIPQLPSPTSALIKISHASLAPGGSIMMQLLPSFLHTYPSIPELDFFGTIAAVGSSVPASRGLVPGANVFGSVPVPQHLRGAGALAEYVALEAGTVALAPGKATAEEAAGLPVSGCSALALMKAAKLERGMKVLVNGASGGVGSLVVQMAKNAVGPEGKVVAMCSGTNADLVKSLGADEVVDYQAHAPVHKFLAGTYVEDKFDVVIDAYGVQDFFAHSAGYLKPRKQFVTVGIAFAEYTTSSLLYAVGQMMKNALLPSWLGGVNRPYAQITGMATLEGLESLRDMVENGQLRGVVDGVWEMENVLEACEKMLSRRARGKIIVKVQE